LIEHATLNKEVKIEVGRKVFHQMLLKSKKSKYPKLHQHTLRLTFDIRIRGVFSFFPNLVISKIWQIFPKTLAKLVEFSLEFFRKKQKSLSGKTTHTH
jgi:hypothetical protein